MVEEKIQVAFMIQPAIKAKIKAKMVEDDKPFQHAFDEMLALYCKKHNITI